MVSLEPAAKSTPTARSSSPSVSTPSTSSQRLSLLTPLNAEAQRFNQGLCGRQVQVTNTNNGESVVATVADECPGCQGNPNSLDLSQGAFDQIADESEGVVPITWEYLS